MTDTEFRDDLRELVKRHSGELEPEDLRAAAADLDATADAWEGIQL